MLILSAARIYLRIAREKSADSHRHNIILIEVVAISTRRNWIRQAYKNLVFLCRNIQNVALCQKQ